MVIQTNIPNHAGLFGNIDFKQGDEARSTYSPAAYLVDLLQMLDDEFEPSTIDFDQRRGDIKGIPLDAENTQTLIPYLDIVNEILEGRVEGGYDTLKTAVYPFNMPFVLNNEKCKNYLHHLGIARHELHRLFAVDVDADAIARDYLGLSPAEVDVLLEPQATTENAIKQAYGYSGDAFVADMSAIAAFIEATALSALEMRELLYQNLYVEPSNHSVVEAGREHFYINAGLEIGDGYVTLNADETTLVWQQQDNGALLPIPLGWFERTSRFIRLAKKLSLSFIELDLILRHCCRVNSVPTLNSETLGYLAHVLYIHRTLAQPIQKVVAVLSKISYTGHTNESLPQDQFNQIFNLACVSVNERYLHVSSVMGSVPPQYADKTYHDYRQISYSGDLFSDDNSDYRRRLRHVLGFSETDLLNIVQQLVFKKVAEPRLWERVGQEWQLLNVFYRIRTLSEFLEVDFHQLFILFELIEQDPFIGQYDPQTHFLYRQPSTQKCFEILMADAGAAEGSSEDSTRPSMADQLWLLDSLMALNAWMKAHRYTPELLWEIVNARPMTDAQTAAQTANDLTLYNALLQSFQTEEIKPDTLTPLLGDQRAARFAFNLLGAHCGASYDYAAEENGYSRTNEENHSEDTKHVLLNYEPREVSELAAEFIQQLGSLRNDEFIDLSLGNKLREKIVRNLVNHQVIDGSGLILTQNLVNYQLAPVEDFMLAYDFSTMAQPVFELFYRVYEEGAAEQQEEADLVEVQVFKSDLQDLGLTPSEARELYDDLIYNGYIDEQGIAQDAAFFEDASNLDEFELDTELSPLRRAVYALLQKHLDRFEASKVKISEQQLAQLDLKPVALQELIENLKLNQYLNENLFVKNKLRLIAERPHTMSIALQFYPYREAVLSILQGAIAAEKAISLTLDKDELSAIADATVSKWAYQDLQGAYLQGTQLTPLAYQFFSDETNLESFTLGTYFDKSMAAIVFERMASIVNYAEAYRLGEAPLVALDFEPAEIESLKQTLIAEDVLDDENLLRAEKIPFFLVPENAAVFSLPSFEDYDKEVFFQLYDIAKAIDNTVKAVDKGLRDHSAAQENAVLEQLQNLLSLDLEAVKAVSAAVFKTDKNLHFAWLKPLLDHVNAVGLLDAVPQDMHYTQAVKRIRQLARLINHQQLDLHEIALALADQQLVDKFPEDLILPSGVESIDTLLATDEFIYLFKGHEFWIYLAADYTLIDQKTIDLGQPEDAALIDWQKKDKARQKRLKEDPIRLLFETENLSEVNAAFIDRSGTWVVVSGPFHYVKYADADVWDRRNNQFGQVDNDFDNIEIVDSAYVDDAGRLFLAVNDKYVRYSDVRFEFDPNAQSDRVQPTIDPGYPKSIAAAWNKENLPIQLPPAFVRDLGPMFDGLDGYSYAFFENQCWCSEDGRVWPAAAKWGHREYDFGHADHIDAALAYGGTYALFLADRVVKYAGSLELADLQPENGYPKPLYEEFPALPDEFVSGIDAAFYGWDNRLYLFRDEDFVSLDSNGNLLQSAEETRSFWGVVANEIERSGRVDAAFVGLDGYTYLFSGQQYVRYSSSDYRQVDDGFPRSIAQDWGGLTEVTGAFVLGNYTYLFGRDEQASNIYVRYATVQVSEDDFLEEDEVDPSARVVEVALANRPDVDEVEVFAAPVLSEFWSLPVSLTQEIEDFQIDAVMNGPEETVYLFYGDHYIEHDFRSRWWSEPKRLADQLDRSIPNLARISAAFTGTDGKTYLFYSPIEDDIGEGESSQRLFGASRYLRFSDSELRRLDNGYPRLTRRFWGSVRNNLERTGQVDTALRVTSHWEEPAANGQLVDRTAEHTYLFSGDQFFRYERQAGEDEQTYSTVDPGYPRSIRRLSEEPRFRGLKETFANGIDAAFADRRQVYLFKDDYFHVVVGSEDTYQQYSDPGFANVQAVTQEQGHTYLLRDGVWQAVNHLDDPLPVATPATPRTAEKATGRLDGEITAILHGRDGNDYVFAGNEYYDVALERSFPIEAVWGRSRNPIYDEQAVDAAFVGRDGVTYLFSGEWFVQYASETYVQQPVIDPPRRISEKWGGLRNVALAYVWEESTYLFERPDASGRFRYVRYTRDNYDRPEPGYPRVADDSLWNIPETFRAEGFDDFDAILVHEDNLIFIQDQQFIGLNLNTGLWSHPQPLDLLYSGIPFNSTDFQTLRAAFVGADGTTYFFGNQRYVAYNSDDDSWSEIADTQDDWGLQENVLTDGVDAAWISPEGVTYLFAGESYVRYSEPDYRFVDAGYPKAIATYLLSEPAFSFLPRAFQQHLNELEAESTERAEPVAFFNGLVDNGRCLYFFSRGRVLTSSREPYGMYTIDGLGHVDNNFTRGENIDAAFVDVDQRRTYLFSGEQYIRYSGDQYR